MFRQLQGKPNRRERHENSTIDARRRATKKYLHEMASTGRNPAIPTMARSSLKYGSAMVSDRTPYKADGEAP